MRFIPQSSAISEIVILSKGFFRSNFFKEASKALFVRFDIVSLPFFERKETLEMSVPFQTDILSRQGLPISPYVFVFQLQLVLSILNGS